MDEVNVTAKISITNMTGLPPPFKSYIRIGEGPYINRVVLGLPDETTGGWTATPVLDENGVNISTTYTLITSWTETDLFPRIPGWNLSSVSLAWLIQCRCMAAAPSLAPAVRCT